MSAEIHYEGQSIRPHDDESVLDALLRVGLDVPFSCKGGSCHTCLMQCTEGKVPPEAQNGLSEHLTRMHYFLPCKCHATDILHVRPPQPEDIVTPCLLCETTIDANGTVRILFEASRTLRYRKGQTLHLVCGDSLEPVITLTSDPDTDFVMCGEIRPVPDTPLPSWLKPETEFGYAFEVRGPYDAGSSRELPLPSTDPALWHELGDGLTVRAVLESFYPKVYADALLSPFFANVTMDRSIDKQYSFLKQCMTGERIFMGDRPRNSHHWMIITHDLFDYRQALMVETLREHSLSEAQIARWTRFEEYFRPDIVKSAVWPRIVGDTEVMNEGFDREVLLEASLCDHCGAEIAQGVEVLYHRRLGTISCPACSGPA